MRKALLIVFFALLTFDVSGLAVICGDAQCDESCPTDVSGGQCSPNCHYCSCCSLPKGASSAAVAVTPSLARSPFLTPSIDRPPSPEAADIQHVPKHVLA